jgi:hypothetical protein
MGRNNVGKTPKTDKGERPLDKTYRYVSRLECVYPTWMRGNRHPRFLEQMPYQPLKKIPLEKKINSMSTPLDSWNGLGQHLDIRI